MSHLDLIADVDKLVQNQSLSFVRLQPGSGPADGKESIVLTEENWSAIRKIVPIENVLSREEGPAAIAALRRAATKAPKALRLDLERVVSLLAKHRGLRVMGGK